MSNQQQQQGQRQNDPNDFLMGGGVPSASFLKVGDSVRGVVSEPPTMQQQRDMDTGALKYWESGEPMMQMVVTLQTEQRDPKIEDDDGRRRIYIKYNMRDAVRDAVKKSGAKGVEQGGTLSVAYTHDGKATARGKNPPKFFAATYEPPTNTFLNEQQQQQSGGAAFGGVRAGTPQETKAAYLGVINRYHANRPDKPYANGEIEATWRSLMGKLFPGRTPSSITPEEWGSARDSFVNSFDAATRSFVERESQFAADDIPF